MRDWRIWLGILVSVASIALVLRQVDPQQVARQVAASDPRYLALLVVSVPLTLWIKAARWRLFFDPTEPVTTRGLYSAIFIGYMVSVIAPLRAGELVRVFLVAGGERIRWSKVLATVVVEKVLDVLAVLVILVAVAAIFPVPDWAVAGAQAGVLVLGASLGGLAALLLMERTFLGMLAWVERAVPLLRRLHLSAFLVSFNEGLGFVRRPDALARVAVWSVAVWVVGAASMWAALVGTGVTATAGAVGLLLSLTNLGMVVPSAPGYVGYYHSLVVVALEPFGVSASQALGTAIVLHALTFGTVLVGGLIYLWRGHYGLGRLLRSSKISRESPEAAPISPPVGTAPLAGSEPSSAGSPNAGP